MISKLISTEKKSILWIFQDFERLIISKFLNSKCVLMRLSRSLTEKKLSTSKMTVLKLIVNDVLFCLSDTLGSAFGLALPQ